MPHAHNIWKNIFGLFLEQKRLFGAVAFISLLGTAANLVEPLIYREAINDITGLFVRQAQVETRSQGIADSTLPRRDSIVILPDSTTTENNTDSSFDEASYDDDSGIISSIFKKISSLLDNCRSLL